MITIRKGSGPRTSTMRTARNAKARMTSADHISRDHVQNGVDWLLSSELCWAAVTSAMVLASFMPWGQGTPRP